MTLRVESEIGKLRRVLVHRPGREIDWMVPSMMERLLFDDILYGEEAREEHDAFSGVLRAAGVETIDPQPLLAEVLASEEARGRLLDRLERSTALAPDLRARLQDLEPNALATTLVTGIRRQEERPDWRMRSFYDLPPIPNWFFQRDPQVVFGDHVLVSSMATSARRREPLLSQIVFEDHEMLRGAAGTVRFHLEEGIDEARFPWLEGGDLLVPSPRVLLIGLSERTNTRGVEALARYLRSKETSFEAIILVELPRKRSYMHLDTVFTFIDHGLCLAYMPVIARGGSEAGHVYELDLGADDLAYKIRPDLQTALAERGLPIELVPCGGGDSIIDQQREQWTDGANAFAIEPGVIVLYRRNRRTVEELERRGFRVIGEEDVLEGGAGVVGHGPTVVTLLGNELSRARGGPRCMTMPLERDALAPR